MPRLAGVGSPCHNKSNTLRQQQQQLADILVQVPLNNYVACCRMGGSRGSGRRVVAVPLVYVLVLFGALVSIFSPAQLLPLLVIRVSGFGVVRWWCLTLSFL